jgi:hypothetical protein
VVALQQQGAALQPGLALAERGEGLAVGRGGRQIVGPHRVQVERECCAGVGGHAPLCGLGLAAEQEDRRSNRRGRTFAPARGGLEPELGRAAGRAGLRRRQRPGGRHASEQPEQP